MDWVTGCSWKYCCAVWRSTICVSAGSFELTISSCAGTGVGCAAARLAGEFCDLLNTENARTKASTASSTPRISMLRGLRTSLLNMEPSPLVVSHQRSTHGCWCASDGRARDIYLPLVCSSTIKASLIADG